MNPQSQQASLALAVHLAVHGSVTLSYSPFGLPADILSGEHVRTGPVSATAVPTGTALARLLALTDALTFALEVRPTPVSAVSPSRKRLSLLDGLHVRLSRMNTLSTLCERSSVTTSQTPESSNLDCTTNQPS